MSSILIVLVLLPLILQRRQTVDDSVATAAVVPIAAPEVVTGSQLTGSQQWRNEDYACCFDFGVIACLSALLVDEVAVLLLLKFVVALIAVIPIRRRCSDVLLPFEAQ